MMGHVRSMGLRGLDGYEISVECYITNGLPGFDVVGLPDAAVKEARERVRAAIKNCGYKFPVSRITLNLAPAGTKKTGTLYDLPMLLGILEASELSLRHIEPLRLLLQGPCRGRGCGSDGDEDFRARKLCQRGLQDLCDGFRG